MSVATLFNKITLPANWSPSSLEPDLSSKVIVVTGGNAGLGYETVRQLARRKPHRIYLTARTKDKYDAAMVKLKQDDTTGSTEDTIRFLQMDLASLASVKRAADTLLQDTDRIDVLINNAGVMGQPLGQTEDGYEVHFGTNHIGHALFTKLLIPTLERSATSGDVSKSDVRIVILSSGAHIGGARIGFDAAAVTTTMSDSIMLTRYGQSKLANILHAKELARRYPHLTSVSINPGRVDTGLLDAMYANGRSLYGLLQAVYDKVVGMLTVEEGAWNQVWAATTDKQDLENGAFYGPVGQPGGEIAVARDMALAKKLWDWQESEFARLGYI